MSSKKKSKVFTEIQRVSGRNQKFKGFFWPKSGEKKVFTDFGWAPEPKNITILDQTTASPSQLRLPNPFGETVFISGAKIDLKRTKNASPPGYATENMNASLNVSNGKSVFNYQFNCEKKC